MTTARKLQEVSKIEPQASLRLVTPEMAATWLANNDHNRKLRKNLVSAYARDMAAGRWVINGEAIQLSVTGKLLNGQHRLNALIESGTTVQLLIVTGLPDEAQDTIDTGAKRQLADVLGLAGYTDGKTLAASATVALTVRYGNRYKATDAEKQVIVENDDVLRWVVANVMKDLPTSLVPKALLAYSYRRLHDVDKDDCAFFFSKLVSLENLPQGSPILALHKRLAALDPKSRSSSWTNRSYMLSLIFIAWNAYRGGESRTLIKPYPNQNGAYKIPDPV